MARNWNEVRTEALARFLDEDRVLLARLALEEKTPHSHAAFVDGCFRCDLSRGEVS